MLYFTPNVKSGFRTFDEVLKRAEDKVSRLPQTYRAKLKDKINHGQGILTSADELDMYLSMYGEIHQAKLNQAFENIPSKVWREGGLSLLDYGCGQGIAEMAFADFLKKKRLDYSVVRNIILIEPGRKALAQAVRWASEFYPDTRVKSLCKTMGQLTESDIVARSQTSVHIFSNVIDMLDFPIEQIAAMIGRDKTHNNVVVCVSPFYQEDGRGKRMDELAQQLNGYNCYYRFQKHTEEWDKPYSCQIRIFVSAYY